MRHDGQVCDSPPTTASCAPAGRAGRGRGTSARSSSPRGRAQPRARPPRAERRAAASCRGHVDAAVPAVTAVWGTGLVAGRGGARARRRPPSSPRAVGASRRSSPTSRRSRSPTAGPGQRRGLRAAADRRTRLRWPSSAPSAGSIVVQPRDHPHRHRRGDAAGEPAAGWSRASPTTSATATAASRCARPRPSCARTSGRAGAGRAAQRRRVRDRGRRGAGLRGLVARLPADRARGSGRHGLVRFYRLVGAHARRRRRRRWPPPCAHVLHETTAQFTAQWRAYLPAQLR